MKRNLLKKSTIALILAGSLLTTGLTGCSNDDVVQTGQEVVNTESTENEKVALYTAGTYTAETTGAHKMTVEVTVSEDEILDIKVDHTETAGIGEPVVPIVVEEVLEIQGLGVDTVSGATLSYTAVMDGIIDCLKQAGISDADLENLKSIKKEIVLEENKELVADVVVIGAGGAGMAAAVTASQNGKSVIVLEKTSQMGGNTILSGGAFNAVDDGSETAIANNDSVENHYNQTFAGGDEAGNPVLVKTLVENAWDGVVWLKDLGMEFRDGTFTVTGGMWPRANKPVEPEGTGFFKTYQEYIDENGGIEIEYNTTATDFIVEDGVVVGVVATGATGNTITARANNGVILATGGFGNNVDLRLEAGALTDKWPALDETVPSTNTSSITGDGIIMADEIGANLVQMEYIQLLPLGDPNTGSLSGNIEHAVESRIFVNLEGNRFVNEAGRRDEMTLGLFEQTDKTMYIVMDSDSYPQGNELNNFGESIEDLVSSNRALKADTLEELAELMGVPAENLVASVEEYNRYCQGGDLEGGTDEFGRALFTDTDGVHNGINNGPFYAAVRVPTVHHTMGGVEINENTEVINVDGAIIPGLYAAGEVTGGIHGTNRLGGNALTDTIVFGRIAGNSASNYVR